MPDSKAKLIVNSGAAVWRPRSRKIAQARVSNDLFEKVIEDKRDNGIIERNIVGKKKRGTLDVDYIMPVLGDTITKW